MEHDASGAMKIDVETQCIITRENGEQVVVDDPASIMLEITVMGQTYHVFKPVQEIVSKGAWK